MAVSGTMVGQKAVLQAKSNSALPEASIGESSSKKHMQKDARLAPDIAPDVYRIGVEDELTVNVWREPELSSSVVVRPDGMITLPLLNDVKVTGMTPMELQTSLTDRLKAFINEPQVVIIPRAIRSRKVYLVGEVGKQGTYPLNGTKTVLQLLTEAGGVSPFAKADSIYVLRDQNGKQTKLPFRYKKAISGKSDREDFALIPGDMIVVP